MFFMKPFTFLSLVVAVVASGNGMTPVMRHSQRHHDLAARVAEPEPVITPLAPNVTRMHRKRSSGRCKASGASSSTPSSSSSYPSTESSSYVESSYVAPSSYVESSSYVQSSPIVEASSVYVAPSSASSIDANSAYVESSSSSTGYTPSPQSDPPSSTSVLVQPTTSSSIYVPPTTSSSSYVAETTSATPTETSSGSTTTYTGDGTWFDVGLGACGLTSESTQMVAAVSESYFDAFDGFTGSNPNDNPICGQMATAVYGTATVTVTIVDRCAGCETDYDLDFSESAFELLTDLSVGRIDIDWWIEGV